MTGVEDALLVREQGLEVRQGSGKQFRRISIHPQRGQLASQCDPHGELLRLISKGPLQQANRPQGIGVPNPAGPLALAMLRE